MIKKSTKRRNWRIDGRCFALSALLLLLLASLFLLFACDRSEETLSDETEEVYQNLHVHTPETVPSVLPTCAKEGLTEGTRCRECHAVLTAQVTVPVVAHTPEVDPAREPTCVKVGLTEGSHCAVCFKILERQTVVEKTEHVFENNLCSCGTYCDSEGLAFTLSGNGYLLSGRGECTDTCIVVPREHEGKSVIGIRANAFDGDVRIETLILPDTVRSIGDEAFDGCARLQTVKLSGGLSDIGIRAFRDCRALAEITVPDGVGQIMEDTFSGCISLQRVVLPKSLMKIRERAFYGCSSLTSLTLPATLNEIGQYAFCDCTQLALSYRGSGAMFGDISLGFGWNENIGSILMNCSDGELDLAFLQ